MTVTELVVKIGADLSGFQNGMNKIEGQLKSVGSSMQSVGMKMTGALTVPIGILGGAMIKAAADAEEMQGMFDVVFSKVGGKVTNDLAKFGKEVGRSRFALMGMAAQFGDTLKPIGFTEEAAGDLSVQLTKLAVDLGSYKNMPMEEALQRLQGTLIGSHENALKFGVIINENVLKQELYRMGADKLTGAQREQAKVQARINLLMAGTSDAQGDAKRTSESFTNQLRALTDELKDISITIGYQLLPFATELVGKLRGLADWFSKLSPETVRMGLAFAGVVAAIGPAIFVMGSLASSLASVFRFVGLLSGLMSPWIFVIGGVAAAAIYLWKNWEQVSASIKGVYDAVKDKFKPALEEIVRLVDGVMDIGAAIFGTLLTWWTDNKEGVLTLVGNMFSAISTAFSLGAEAVGVVLNVGLNSLVEFWDAYGKTIVGVVGLGLMEVLNMTANIMGILGGIIQIALSASRSDWSGAWEAMKGVVATQMAATQTTISNFANAIPGILGGEDGKGVASGDSVGAEDMRKKLDAALALGMTAFTNFKNSVVGSLAGGGGVSESVDDSKDKVDELGTAIDDATRQELVLQIDKMGVSFETVKTAMQGAPDELRDMKESIKEMLKEIPTELPEYDIKVNPPDPVAVSNWNTFFFSARDFFENLGNSTFSLSNNIRNIGEALKVLGLDSRFTNSVVDLATDIFTVVRGFESLMTLLDVAFWKELVQTFIDLGKAVYGIFAGSGGDGTKSPGPVVPGMPGGDDSGTGQGTGPVIPGGTPVPGGGAGSAVKNSAIAAAFAWLGSKVFAGFQTREYSQAELDAILAQIAASNFAGFVPGGLNLDGTEGIDWSWLQGGFGSAFDGGSGDWSGRAQNITINLDGRQIARSIMPYTVDELMINGTTY